MIVIVDYGMGNLRSVYKALNRLGIASLISSDLADIEQSEKLILPGVGHFAHGMENIHKMGLYDILNRRVMVDKTPILGICLGMQLFCKKSEEGDATGLGWLDADTVRFDVSDAIDYKIPHIGWNSMDVSKEHPLFHNMQPDDSFYFVHSYHAVCHDEDDVLSYTEYDYRFVSAMQKDNIMGTQFHPEKSRKTGLEILKNFAEQV